MTKDKKSSGYPVSLTVDYALLGTVSIDELLHAMDEDIQIIKDTYNVRYVRGFRLQLPVTNEYGFRFWFELTVATSIPASYPTIRRHI